MEKLPQVVSDPEMIIVSDDENVSDEEVCPVEPTPRENLNTDDVFSKSSKKKIVEEGVPVVQKVKTETKKGKTRKPLSEEHKAKLAEARKKALETRRANAAEKKALKELEEKATEKSKAKKKKELEDIVNEVPPEPVKPVEVKAEVDPEIIQRAIDEALAKNEMMRQKRKAEKKAKIDEEVRRKKAEEEIKQMVYPPSKIYYGDKGFYSKHIFNTH
jgi:hypothetical protein